MGVSSERPDLCGALFAFLAFSVTTQIGLSVTVTLGSRWICCEGIFAWHVSPSKTALIKFPIGSSSCSSLPIVRAHSPKAQPSQLSGRTIRTRFVSLREIAEKTISAGDMLEGLIHSIQKEVEIDEPEAAAAPILPSHSMRPTLGRDDPATDVIVDTLTEDELLRGLERLTPEEPSVKGDRVSGDTAGRRY